MLWNFRTFFLCLWYLFPSSIVSILLLSPLKTLLNECLAKQNLHWTLNFCEIPNVYRLPVCISIYHHHQHHLHKNTRIFYDITRLSSSKRKLSLTSRAYSICDSVQVISLMIIKLNSSHLKSMNSATLNMWDIQIS